MSDAVPYLSFSKIDKAVLCPLQFKFKYVDKIPEKSSGVMLSGSAVHEVIEHALTQVKFGKPLPSAADLDDVYMKAWDRLIADEESKKWFIGWQWDEDEKFLRESYRPVIKLAHTDLLPKTKPRFVEEEINFNVQTPIGPVRVNGYVDLIETIDGEDWITDWKTSDKVSARQKKMGLQGPCYSNWAVENNIGGDATKFRKVFLLRGPRPKIEPVPFEIHERHRAWFRQVASAVWQMIEAEAWVPITETWMCSEKFCPYFEGCVGGLS